MKQTKKGGFTLPGEAGCEALTLELADRWGADVIRDSDGTELSDEILDAGYSIYSTICLIRDHNEWAREHPDCLQQTFLTTRPCLAGEGPLSVALLADFFDEQFRVNDGETARRYWQGLALAARLRLRRRGPSHALPQLYGQLPGLSDLGRDLDVQPSDQPLGQGTPDAH